MTSGDAGGASRLHRLSETNESPVTSRYAIDLHMHSTYSDGLMTPAQLCEQADQLHLQCIALSDHDTAEGLAEMAEAAQSVRLARASRGDGTPFSALDCIELSAGSDGKTHLLGYGVNARDDELQICLAEAEADRRERAERMLALLREQAIEIPPELRARLDTPRVGRAHFARVLVQMGVVHTMRQAFDRYLAEGRCAYVPRRWMDTRSAIRCLRRAGAVAVLAHPMRLGLSDNALYALIKDLQGFGLNGLEVYHPSANPRAARELELLARREGLLVTGGSDYHGEVGTHADMSKMPPGWRMANEDLKALLDAMNM